jgi:hypothetical protein
LPQDRDFILKLQAIHINSNEYKKIPTTRNDVFRVPMNTTSHCRVLGAAGRQKGEILKIESATEG